MPLGALRSENKLRNTGRGGGGGGGGEGRPTAFDKTAGCCRCFKSSRSSKRDPDSPPPGNGNDGDKGQEKEEEEKRSSSTRSRGRGGMPTERGAEGGDISLPEDGDGDGDERGQEGGGGGEELSWQQSAVRIDCSPSLVEESICTSRGASLSPKTAEAAAAYSSFASGHRLDSVGVIEKSSRKLSWRAKTWQSEATRDSRGEDTASGEAQSRPNYSRKHSLTVPGEHRYFHHHHHHHHQLQRMGHQQHQSPAAPSEPKVEVKQPDRSRSPSPLSTPSPSGSASIAGDEHSGCSSCSSTGLGYDLARKCTVSADSLLLHPDIAGSTSRSQQEEFGQTSAEAPAGPSKAYLEPEPLSKRKISTSLSSDQIHQHLSTGDPVDGTRSASPKLLQARKPTTPEKEGAEGEAGTSREEKRKTSVATAVLSGPGRLARLLRRTHSAGCSKDVPAYALFLREKPIRSRHADGMLASTTQHVERKRGRKQAPALEDMKQRLRFLRRRHTDSSLDPSSVRPNPEEAQKWAQSFHILMSNRYGSALFKAFLSQEFSQENIEFWMVCEEYRKARVSKYPSKARKIYDEFIAIKSPKEINIDGELRNSIQQNVPDPDIGIFDVAQRKIQGLLESDSYPRFLQSDLYKELLVPSPPNPPPPPPSKGERKHSEETGKKSPESDL